MTRYGRSGGGCAVDVREVDARDVPRAESVLVLPLAELDEERAVVRRADVAQVAAAALGRSADRLASLKGIVLYAGPPFLCSHELLADGKHVASSVLAWRHFQQFTHQYNCTVICTDMCEFILLRITPRNFFIRTQPPRAGFDINGKFG